MAEEYNTTVDPDHVRQLRRFRADNSYGLYKMIEEDTPATDQEIRELLIFAAGHAPRGGRHEAILPRALEALRVIKLVPEDVGATLFEGVTV